ESPAVPPARQATGGGEPGRPRPHNGHTFSPAMPGWSYFAFGRGTIVHSEAFQVANGNGCVNFSTPAHVLAGGGADAAADAGKGVRLRSHLQRFIVASLGDQADV